MGCTSSVPPSPAVVVTEEKSIDQSFFLKYTLSHKLGKGGFAQVRAAKSKVTEARVAVKILDLREATGDYNQRHRREAIEEAAAWRRAGQHENLVTLKDAFMEEGLCFFVMELCATPLQKYLQRGAGEIKLTERALSRVFQQVLAGCAHLHDLDVVHRDIKPDNMMVSNGLVKLCDFGLAAVLPSKGGGLSGVFGTAPFMAPEMLLGNQYNQAVDVWSIGVMAYLLLYGTFPYVPLVRKSSEMKKAIKEGFPSPAYEHLVRSSGTSLNVSNGAECFVRALLLRDPLHRPHAEEAMARHWIQRHQKPADNSHPLSFAPALTAAVRLGGFENRPIFEHEGLDNHLRLLHWRAEGHELLDHPAKPSTEAPAKILDGCKPNEFAEAFADASLWKAPSEASTETDLSSLTASNATSLPSTLVPSWRTSHMSDARDNAC